MQGMRRKAIDQGAKYLQATVVDVEKQGAKVTGVLLDNGERYSCGQLINAAGLGARQLSENMGITIPLEYKKRSVFYFQSPVELPNCPMTIDPTGAYFRPGEMATLPASRPQKIKIRNALITSHNTNYSKSCYGPFSPSACPPLRRCV